MARFDKRVLRNVISRLVGLGKTIRAIFTYLKSDLKFKYVTNAVISKVIAVMQLAHSRGKAANKIDSSEPIGAVFGSDEKKHPKRICIGYEFIHDAGGKSKRGSSIGASELGSVEVETSSSTAEIRSKILDTIQSWLDKHYETSNKRQIKSSLKFTTIHEC